MREGETKKWKDLIQVTYESMTDLLALVASLIIVLTLYRLVFFIAIVSVNGHTTYFNERLRSISKGMLMIKLTMIETSLAKQSSV